MEVEFFLHFANEYSRESQQRNRTMSPKNSNEPVGKVMDLTTTIQYQQGSVVSKTLIDAGTATVTLFAFDESQGLSEHTVPFDALATVLDGEAEITISGERHSVKAGQLIIMPAGEPHSVRAPARFKMMLVMVKA